MDIVEHKQKMKIVFHDIIHLKCDYCKKYIKRMYAIHEEVCFYDFIYCSDTCYCLHKQDFTRYHREMFGFC